PRCPRRCLQAAPTARIPWRRSTAPSLPASTTRKTRTEGTAAGTATMARPSIRSSEALEETLQLLFGVPGIHRVSPGTDEEGTPVVLIFTARGFSRPSMDRIPEEVRGFKTLLVVPYDLLPLRRLV